MNTSVLMHRLTRAQAQGPNEVRGARILGNNIEIRLQLGDVEHRTNSNKAD